MKKNKKFPKLGVNIDHIATLRQLRGTPYPDLTQAAKIVEFAGADQITIHLREDRRHINDQDVLDMKKVVKTSLNLEMAISPEIVRFALKVKPDWICLVPEKRQEVTTEGGLNVKKHALAIEKIIKKMRKQNIKTSLFVEPDVQTVLMSCELGADAVEVHTGKFCSANQGAFGKKSKSIEQNEYRRIVAAGLMANELGMGSHAGHGFDYENVKPIVAEDLFSEFNIGHAIVCRAAIVGLERSVREMVATLRNT